MNELDIVMPAHQVHEYLNQSIESILNQSFGDFRLIVIDDSIDGSVSTHVKNGFQDKRVQVVRSNEHSVEGALNVGLSYCEAKYVARMDSDDIAFTNRFERQIDYLKRNPQIGILGAWATLVDSNSKIIGKAKPPETPEQIIENLCHLVNPIIHPLVVFNINQCGRLRYPTNNKFMEDLGLWISKIDRVIFYNMPETLLYYRVHNLQTSRNSYAIEELVLLADRVKKSETYRNLDYKKQKSIALYLENLIVFRTSKLIGIRFRSAIRAYEHNKYFGITLIQELFGTVGVKASLELVFFEAVKSIVKFKLFVILVRKFAKARLKRLKLFLEGEKKF